VTPATIWLVRHASTDWTGKRWCGRADPPLTDAGRAEAAALGERLAPRLGGRVLVRSSPLRRALATADAIASSSGDGDPRRAVVVDPDLVEVDVGEAEGLAFDDIAARFPAIASLLIAGRRDVDWPGGEAADALRARVDAAWAAARTADADTVVLVSHGGVLRTLVDALVAPEGWPDPIGPASEIRVDRAADGWRPSRP
jgi:broad specificity phosphatase PhoE